MARRKMTGWCGRSRMTEARRGVKGRSRRFPNRNSAVDLLKLKNGHLLLVYNDSMSRRTPLTVVISTDGDKSYAHRKNIAEGRNSYAYPISLQSADAKIHIMYTSDERSVIHHRVFEEGDILR